MARIGLCGASYTSQSSNSDDQQLMNMYLEQNQDPNAKSPFSLYQFGGLKVFSNSAGDAPARDFLFLNGRVFAAIGAELGEIKADGTFTVIGAIARDSSLATFASSSTQFMVTSGGLAYSYDLATSTFAPIVGMLGTTSMCAYMNGFFIVLLAGNQFQWSTPGDVTAWNGADTAEISVFPDNCVAMKVDHQTLWFFGLTKSAPYALTGTFGLVFEPITSGAVEQGCAAKFSVIQMDNSLFWWGSDERGAMIAWRLNGYLPVRVSNHAIEFAVQGYTTVSDAVSYSYQDQGHTFWQTYFPSANGGKGATWVYDAATGMWCERSFSVAQTQTAHRSWCHVFAFGKHLVGDWATGTIYQMNIGVKNASGSWDFCDDFGTVLRRSRRCPIISTENQQIFFSQLEIDLEVGLGPVPPLTNADGTARGPQLILRWSNDSGQTWSDEQFLDCGQAGQYQTRVIARRLGRARKGRIFEIAMTDPVPLRITDGYLRASGYETTQRISDKLRQGA